MVMLKTTLAGASLLVIGLVLLAVLGPYITVQVEDVQTREVEPHAEFLVGDVVDKAYDLPASVPAFGSVDVTQAPTNASGDIRFMVFDADNYQKWSSGQTPNSFVQTENQGKFNFNFTTTGSGVYHFVFDNRASLFKKYVVLSIAYSEIVISHVPDQRVPYVAYALLAGGIILLALGLARKPPIPWA